MLYRDLADDLRRKIELGLLQPGDRLPSEFQLAQTYRMSRTTVRLALDDLKRQGHIRRQQGLGTFVARPDPPTDVVTLASCERDIEAQGLKSALTVLELGAEAAESDVASALKIEAGTRVTRISRLRLADGEAVCHDLTYLPSAIGDKIAVADLEHERICNLLRHRFGIEFSRRSLTFRAAPALAATARLLGLKPGSPLFLVEICTYARLGWPVEYQRRFYRSDRLSYVMNLDDLEAEDHAQARITGLQRLFA